MATKQTNKDAKPTKTTRTSRAPVAPKAIKTTKARARVSADVDDEPTARPRRAARPTLHVAHASKTVVGARPAAAPRLKAAKTAGDLSRAPARDEGLVQPPRPSRPPRAPKTATPATTPYSGGAQLALAVAAAALDKKAMNVEIIDLAGKADYADYLVLMSGSSDRHVRALADAIEQSLAEKKLSPISVEGANSGNWVLLDFGDVVAHVFQQSVRALYDIEGLWLDAGRVPLPG